MSRTTARLRKSGESSLSARGSTQSVDASAPPPAYSAVAAPEASPSAAAASGRSPPNGATTEDPPEPVNVNAAFEKLSLANPTPSYFPTSDACLAHLKLLYAIQSMKEDVGYTDGLWSLWDSRAGPVANYNPDRSIEERLQDKQLQVLSQIREKRWALFVARAVERYEALRKTFPARPLSEADMLATSSDAYIDFTKDNNPPRIEWTEDMLPPLDVLMVWHTHMLNPQSYLEDSMLSGFRAVWHSGMPWELIHRAIDTDFAYNVSDDCKALWCARTGLSWENADDPLLKTMRCPRCSTPVQIPWTTCGMPEDYGFDGLPDLTGNGYGDGDLQYRCLCCGVTICKELLSAAKFAADTSALLAPIGRPMPGTILNPLTGKPDTPPIDFIGRARVPRTFPNRLLKSGCNQIRSKMVELVTSRRIAQPTMRDVRSEIEKIFGDRDSVRQIDALPPTAIDPSKSRYRLDPIARICIRKMMSRYWENFSPFALDLCAAVMRQGIFVEKMYKLDWLHSPSARDTMDRLRIKYNRFVDIMAASPDRIAVPTLDVDLAWHTHQLSPSAYYQFMVLRTARFIDHDDKIEEQALSKHFEWTSKEYQEKYGEVYSECTCWYCESIRSSLISPVGKVLGLSNQEKVAESFHTSGAAKLCPPSNSAHISSHNSVKTQSSPGAPASFTRSVQRYMGEVHRKRLDAAYAKAQKRAAKKGRKIPPKIEYYDHWGYPYAIYGAYMYPMWWSMGMYYGACPAVITSCGGGSTGGCCNGTCGGGVAAGACGGPGNGGSASGDCGGCGGGGGGGGGCGGGGGGCGGWSRPTEYLGGCGGMWAELPKLRKWAQFL
ncbi:hypothetical protein B0T14DRAFT_490016 [Immersiella caudata]|uniref:Glycine-rich domain-containing protein 1 n=1 Tax=Immersiella caudata TaxID=314043 RepID=A0AA39XD59_9PEZI|nr:hypothetical protein B0T14DRAFT_490016 [Immersiella caudata]